MTNRGDIMKLIWEDEIDEELKDLPEIRFSDNAPGLETLSPEELHQLAKKAGEQLILSIELSEARALGQIH